MKECHFWFHCAKISFSLLSRRFKKVIAIGKSFPIQATFNVEQGQNIEKGTRVIPALQISAAPTAA